MLAALGESDEVLDEVLKTPGEIELMDQANRIVHQVLAGVGESIAPGVTTRELDRFAESTIRGAGRCPGLPELPRLSGDAVHLGQRRDRARHSERHPFEDGDIVGIDCGVVYKGYYGDAAATFAVGRGRRRRRSGCCAVTEEALDLAVEQVRPDDRLSDIGHAVQATPSGRVSRWCASSRGTVSARSLHEEPQVPNYGEPGRGPKLRPGLVLAIEPMVNAGGAGGQGGRRRLDGAYGGRLAVGPLRVLGGGHPSRRPGAGCRSRSESLSVRRRGAVCPRKKRRSRSRRR